MTCTFIAIGDDSYAFMQVRYGSTAAGLPSVTPASNIDPHGSHVQRRFGHALHKPDHSDMQISNNKSECESIKQIRDLLAEIDTASSSRNSVLKCNAAVTISSSAMCTACDNTVRANSTRDPNTTACHEDPQTSIMASAVACSDLLERTDPSSKVIACNLREDVDRDSDSYACNTAGAALPPSAMDMDDQFCRWQCIARQNQSTGSSAYPALPYWAAQIAPYPACEINSNRYQTSFWDKY